MDTTTNLFIRACKGYSDNSLRRLRRLFNMFYLKQEDVNRIDRELVYILSGIVDDYSPIGVRKYITDLESKKMGYAMCNEDLPSETSLTLSVLIDRIRFTSTDKFDGYVRPARFRREG